MYHCKNCRKEFEFAKIYFEKDMQKPDTYEKFLLCPFCESTDFFEKKGLYCRYCSAKLTGSNKEYCSTACRKRGERMFKFEIMKNEKRKTDILFSAITEVNNYNKRTGCSLSYGQYYALKSTGRI